MQLIKKFKWELVFGLSILLIYFISRLVLLTSLPIFTDEAIYIRWAQIALHDASWRFISLTDGKQPLFIWIMMFFIKAFHDPVLSGRLVSVVSGAVSLVALWLLSWELFKNKTVSFLSALLYVFYPLALIHDRLAIYDTMVAMWYLWALYFSVLLFKNPKLIRSYNLGVILGASVLTKSGGFISMALLPFVFILANFKQSALKLKLAKLAGMAVLSIGIGLVMYSILRLSPLYGTIAVKNDVFMYSLKEWLSQPLVWRYQLLIGNLHGMLGWFLTYYNPLFIVFLIVGLVVGRYWKEKLVLLIYFLAPFTYAGMFGKVLFPRYILFMTVVLLPIIAFGIDVAMAYFSRIITRTQYRIAYLLIIFLTILPAAYTSYLWITDPINAPVSGSDRGQYAGSWPAGWGVKEAIAYIDKQAVGQKVYLGTQGTFGLMPFAFEMYMIDNPNVTTMGYWPIDNKALAGLLKVAQRMPTYIYFYQPCTNCPGIGVAPANWPVTPVLTVIKNGGNVHATLYKVNSKKM